MQIINYTYEDLGVTFYDPKIEKGSPMIIEDGMSNILLTLSEAIALRDFLIQLDLGV